jgi:hypothetical protein
LGSEIQFETQFQFWFQKSNLKTEDSKLAKLGNHPTLSQPYFLAFEQIAGFGYQLFSYLKASTRNLKFEIIFQTYTCNV